MCIYTIVIFILLICGSLIYIGIYQNIKDDAIETAKYCFNNKNLIDIDLNSSYLQRCEYMLELKEDNELEGFDLIYVWTWKDTFRKKIHCLNYNSLISNSSLTDHVKYDIYCK